METFNQKRKSPEYKQQLNNILRTSQKITLSVAQDDLKQMQLATILIQYQIGQALEMLGQENKMNNGE